MNVMELATKNEHENHQDYFERKLQWIPKINDMNSPKKLTIKYDLIKLAK